MFIIGTGDDKHEVPVNVLHNIIVKAVRCDLSHTGANFLKTNTKQVPDRPNKLTEYRISDSVTVRVSDTLINLLNNVAQKRSYTPQNGGTIAIYDDNQHRNNPVFTCNVTDPQALLALASTLQEYDEEWKEFFWDAWLAVTIQLGLIEKVDYVNVNKEVFPCLWMSEVFYAERLVGSPENIKVLLMGQHPNSRESNFDHLVKLHEATGISNIGDNQQSVKPGINLTKSKKCSDYCKAGLLLVNMIRCITRNGRSIDNNDYYYAWFCYTLRLVQYCVSNNKPVVLCSSSNNDNNLVRNIRAIEPDLLIEIPFCDEITTKSIPSGNLHVSRTENTVMIRQL